MESPKIPLDRRPDLAEMAAPEYDIVSETPAEKTLLICSAPRTGSYELCRYLMAAGIGVPHEYFHPQFAGEFGKRFGIEGNPLDGPNVQPYIDALRKNRGQNGVLAINLQYWQLSGFLINPPGNSLFGGALVVYLFRPDIGNQVTSWRVAMNTGIWDYSGRKTSDGRPYPEGIDERIAQYEIDLKFVVGEDAGFREFFALAGIDPLFVTTRELFRAPLNIIRQTAEQLGASVNQKALQAMIERSKRYPHDEAAYQRATEGLAVPLHRRAFGQQ